MLTNFKKQSIHFPKHEDTNYDFLAHSFYLHGSSFGESYDKVLPLPVLLHHMGKNDMSISAGPGQLGAIRRPGQAEHTACVGFLQCIGPLEGEERGKDQRNID